MERRYEIDWIRNISILMLFVYHTAAIFCIFGDFYIVSEQKNILANLLIVLMCVWYMPTLFFLAGASTYFASQKRSFKEYMLERVKKLFIPLIFGILVLVPPQAYLARVWRGEDNISYFEHLKYFFTHLTDWTGYDGAFSPAHLWFILYLFIVSIIGGLIIFKLFKSSNNIVNVLKSVLFNKNSVLTMLILGIVSDFFPSIMGKSVIGCLVIFIIGYLVYSDDDVLERMILKRFKFLKLLTVIGVCGMMYVFIIRDILPVYCLWILDSLLKNIVLISAIGSIVGFASIYLNKNNELLKYLNASAFPVYIIHQPILLGLAFVIIPFVKSTILAMALIISISFILTFAVFEVIKRMRFMNLFLGMK